MSANLSAVVCNLYTKMQIIYNTFGKNTNSGYKKNIKNLLNNVT